MCRFRQVRNIYLKCGHAENLAEDYIYCEDSRCKFSPFHPKTCQPPKCTETCFQFRKFPEQYNPQINGWCPACTRANQNK